MQELKILEEIDQEVKEYMEIDFGDEYNAGIKDMAKMAKKIVRKHMKNEEDILKFYYCESEDDYYIGQRIQNMYYAKYGPGGFIWFMSRYLPWGTDGYPSEPKEIPFMEWIEGFIRKHMNNGWIPVDKNNIPEDEILACDGYKNELIGYLRYNPDGEEFICESDECIMHQVTAWMPRPEPYKPERSEGE